jgi:hypothetical protein
MSILEAEELQHNFQCETASDVLALQLARRFDEPERLRLYVQAAREFSAGHLLAIANRAFVGSRTPSELFPRA